MLSAQSIFRRQAAFACCHTESETRIYYFRPLALNTNDICFYVFKNLFPSSLLKYVHQGIDEYSGLSFLCSLAELTDCFSCWLVHKMTFVCIFKEIRFFIISSAQPGRIKWNWTKTFIFDVVTSWRLKKQNVSLFTELLN